MKTEARQLVTWVLLWAGYGLPLPVLSGVPVIDFPPQDQSVILYQQAAFRAVASGTPPLYYQWSKDGVPILGKTNDHFVIARPEFRDAGLYSVIVSNAANEFASTNATLTVRVPLIGDLDYSFAVGGSINGDVRCIEMQSSGKILIGGTFSTVHGGIRGGIARLNADGSTDYTFLQGLAGCNGNVYSTVTQDDGKVVIGGVFTSVNGAIRKHIARLLPDGSLDNSFSVDLLPSYAGVNSVALQTDGKVIFGGYFTNVNGVARNCIARLNADGTLDGTFQGGLSGANKAVHSLAVQSDGKVLIGGLFTQVNGVSRNHIARLNSDGSLDNSFQQGMSGVAVGWGGSIYAIAIQNDGKVLIGGNFGSVNNSNRNSIARLQLDGSLDTSFQASVSSDDEVRSLALQSNGSIIIAGTFTSVNGVSRGQVARININGSLDMSFSGGGVAVTPYQSGRLYSVALNNDGKVVIGGRFYKVGNLVRNSVARLDSAGSPDNGFENQTSGVRVSKLGTDAGGNVFPGAVYAIAIQSDGKILLGGDFITANGRARNAIARFNPDGTSDVAFQGFFGVNSFVTWITPLNDGKMLVAGSVASTDGFNQYGIVRLNADGTFDSSFRSYVHAVNSLAVLPNGKIVIGGEFQQILGVGRSGVARLNADGTLDSAFLNGMEGIGPPCDYLGRCPRVNWLSVQNDGKVIIGGDFTTVNGVARGRIARLNADGSLDTGFMNGLAGANDLIDSVVVQGDGKILIGGGFTSVNGLNRWHIARLNSDGTLDTGFQAGLSGANSAVYSIAVQQDGRIFIGGEFSTVNGVARYRLARLNSDGTLDTFFQGGLFWLNDAPAALLVQDANKLLVGGFFDVVNGESMLGLARIWSSVDIPPFIKSVTWHGADMSLTWDSISNRNYRVQHKMTLEDMIWTDLPGDIPATSNTASKLDTTTLGVTQRFYRVLLLP